MKSGGTGLMRMLGAALMVWAGATVTVLANEAGGRILNIRSDISARTNMVKLKDMVSNPAVLSQVEGEYEILNTPTESDSTLTLVDIAYMLQKYPSLMDARLKGPRMITVKCLRDMRYVELAKRQMLEYLKNNPPWKSWEIELVFDHNCESQITRVGHFERISVIPFDTKGMIGVVDFHVDFYDDNGRLLKKLNLQPKIMRRAQAYVLKDSRGSGHVVGGGDLKQVPVWIGGEKNSYITEENQCVGKELARDVTAGEFLRSADMVNPICARRGETIWVTCQLGALSVRLAVLAQQNGRLGDTIRAMNRSTNKVIDVELTGMKQAVHRMGT